MTSPPASKLSTVRSATHSTAPPLASCAGASTSSGGCGRGGVAPPVAAPCTNGRTDGSAQDSASSTDSFARRPSCPRLRRLFRRVRREADGTPAPRRLTRKIITNELCFAASPSYRRLARCCGCTAHACAQSTTSHHRSPVWGRPFCGPPRIAPPLHARHTPFLRASGGGLSRVV